MATLVEKIKLSDEKQQQLSITLVDRVQRLKVTKELSLVRGWMEIF